MIKVNTQPGPGSRLSPFYPFPVSLSLSLSFPPSLCLSSFFFPFVFFPPLLWVARCKDSARGVVRHGGTIVAATMSDGHSSYSASWLVPLLLLTYVRAASGHLQPPSRHLPATLINRTFRNLLRRAKDRRNVASSTATFKRQRDAARSGRVTGRYAVRIFRRGDAQRERRMQSTRTERGAKCDLNL